MPRKAVLLLSVAALTGCAIGDVPLRDNPKKMEVVTPQRTGEDFAALEDENQLATVAPQAEEPLDALSIPSPDAPSRAPVIAAAPVAKVSMPTDKTAPAPAAAQIMAEAEEETVQNEDEKVGRAPAQVAPPAPVAVADIPEVITGEAASMMAMAEEPVAPVASVLTSAEDLNAAQLSDRAMPVAAPVMAHTEPAEDVPAIEETAPAVIAEAAAAPAGIPQIVASTEGAHAPKAEDDVTRLLAAERAVSTLNAYRAENGLPPLQYNEELSRIAEAHVVDLAARGEVTARNRDGQGIGERLQAAGLAPKVAGSLVSGGYATFEGALESWKANEVQRQRLLIEAAGEVGFAVISDRTSTYGIYMELIIAETDKPETDG